MPVDRCGRPEREEGAERRALRGARGVKVDDERDDQEGEPIKPVQPVRGGDQERVGRDVREPLGKAGEFALERASYLGGTDAPTVYLAGFSSGGLAVGAVAFRYPEIKRILLLSTYDSVGDYFYTGVEQFTGDIYMAYGSQDPMAGFLAYVLGCGSMAANSLHVRQVPECDHRFSGATNSKILTKAFYWAFNGDESFPSAEGGLQLYD